MLKNEKKANEIISNKVGSLAKTLHLDSATLDSITKQLKNAKTTGSLFWLFIIKI